ncbi:response regulator [Nocardia heshunensis]
MSVETTRRVLIVDDHPLFRAGLADAIGTDRAFTVVAQAATAHEAFAAAEQTQPEVVVMDLGLPGLSGVEAIRELLAHHPRLRILVMTMSEDSDSLLAAMRAGAHGYLRKDSRLEETLHALHTVARGGSAFGTGTAEHLSALLTAGDTATGQQAFPTLTARELEILDHVARGLTYHQIAQRLVVTDKTIRNHIGSIFAKLQVHDRAEAVIRARRAGMGGD